MSSTESAQIVNHRISVEKLSDDYLSSTGENSGFVAGNCESPAMFKRNGTYYLLTDNTCAFGPQGSGTMVYTAPSPIGPFTYRGNNNFEGPVTDVPPSWPTLLLCFVSLGLMREPQPRGVLPNDMPWQVGIAAENLLDGIPCP
jgi:hypothetical protein